MVGGSHICDNCGHNDLALDKWNAWHTKMHSIVRIFEKVEEKKPWTEEWPQQLLEKMLARMEKTLAEQTQTLAGIRQILEMPAEKSAGRSPYSDDRRRIWSAGRRAWDGGD
jgi:hypothetical protein